MIARRVAASAAANSSKLGTETTRAATPRCVEQLLRLDRDRDFRAGGEDRHVAPGRRPGRSRRRRPRRGCRRRTPLRSCGRFCRVSASTLGPSWFSSASCQHSSVSTASHGRNTQQVRDRAQRREMLDRLVRRAVFAEPDRVVRHHMDHALAHQRGEPDRRAAIVGEHQERAGIRDDAADAAPCRSSPPPCRARGCRSG